jgi:lipopolysaccharide export system protein LptA
MNRSISLLLAALALPLAVVAPEPAAAQFGGDSKAPVDIAANQFQAHANQCSSRWSGDAEVLQDNSRLRANTLDVYYKVLGAARPGGGGNCGDPDHYDADGDVFYVTPTEIVRGDHAIYNADAKTILFTGQVVVARGKDVMAGTRLLIHTDTREATMESDVTGRGRSGRVRAVLFPNAAQGGGAGGLQPPKPPPPRQHGA